MHQDHLESVVELIRVRKIINNLRAQSILRESLDKKFIERLRPLLDDYMGLINAKLEELGVKL